MSHVTLEALNKVARHILRGREFVHANGQLKIFTPDNLAPQERWRKRPFLTCVLASARNWFKHRAIPRFLGLGGTDEQTLCQLILWYRGQPRLPMRVLAYWQRDDPGFVADLEASGYDDAKSTTCVLCGAVLQSKTTGLDWWSLDGVTGPSCDWGKCKERPK